MKSTNEKGYSRGVGVFILEDGQLLLTYRIKGDQIGVWEVVAGHTEENESPEETAVRETREETGLVIRVTKRLGVNIDDTHRFEADMFLAEIVSGVAENLDERNHSALEWFNIDNLPSPLGSTTIKGIGIIKQQS